MKKKLAVLLALALVAVFSVSLAENTDRLSQIKERGYITIATEGDWAPYTYHDESNALVGYDVEIGQAIAEYLGVEARFNEAPWDSILAGVEAGRYDVLINCVGVTEERQKKYDYSDPYAYNKPVIIVRGDNDEIHSFEDLKGKTTANTASSTYAALAESYGATNQPVDDLNQTLQLLIDNRIDATVNSADTFNEYMTNNPDVPLKIAARADSANSVVIVMPKGEKAATLEEAINKAIDELKQDGTLAALSVKYFDTDMTNAPEGSAQAN